MERMKTMTVIWGMMVISIVLVLTFIGFTYNKKLKDYQAFENKLGKVSEKYVDENTLIKEDTKKIKINIKDLKKKGYIDKLEVNKNKCNGYVLVEVTKEDIDYQAFIDCGKYQTEGYKDGR